MKLLYKIIYYKEVYKIKEFIINNLNTATPYGEYKKKLVKPFKKNKSNLLKNELNYIESIIKSKSENKYVFNEIDFIFCKIKDIKNTIKKLERKAILDEIELFEIKNFAMYSEDIKDNYDKLNLQIDYIKFESLKEIIQLLDPDDLKLHTFQVYESYTHTLKKIRTQKYSLENQIFKEEDYEKIENLKKERLGIVIKEEKEELSIKMKLTNNLLSFVSKINNNIESLSNLDFLIAKSNLALKYNAIKPDINNENRIYFKNLINPDINLILNKQNKSYMPISVDINKKITLITGANMCGKSVSMKTIALNLYLFQCGFYVFAKQANLPVLDFIYLISDDMQDINNGLSTFGAEIIKLKEIINVMKLQDGFIALDEFARGTNPKEGKILLKSVCSYLKKFNSISLISTHYDEVIDNEVDHYQVIGLKNVDFDSLKYKIYLNRKQSISLLQDSIDYRLEKVKKDLEVPKDALNICTLLGLDNEIINIANSYYKGENDD